MKLGKAVRNSIRFNLAKSFMDVGKLEKAKTLLLSLESEIGGKHADYHLLLASTYQALGEYPEGYSHLISAKGIVNESSKYNKEEKDYLYAYILEQVLDSKGNELSESAIAALSDAIPQSINYRLVSKRLVRWFPLCRIVWHNR